MSEQETAQIGDSVVTELPVVNDVTPEPTPEPILPIQTQEPVKKDRMAAARAALAKKRATRALIRLEKEKMELNRRLGIDQDPAEVDKPTEIVVENPQENNDQQEVPVEEIPKEVTVEKDKEEEKKMSSSDDIVIEPIQAPKELHLSPIKRKREDPKKKKKKEKEKKKQTKPPKPMPKKVSSSTSDREEEQSEDEPPRKKQKTITPTIPNIEKQDNDEPKEDEGVLRRGANLALHNLRNVTIPPVVVDHAKSALSSVGWATFLCMLLFLKRDLQHRVERFLTPYPPNPHNPNIGATRGPPPVHNTLPLYPSPENKTAAAQQGVRTVQQNREQPPFAFNFQR